MPIKKQEKSAKWKNRDLKKKKKISVRRHNKIDKQKFLNNPDECLQSFFKKLEQNKVKAE